ncbi:MAG: hypothetical protein GYB67_12595 [Chloroflexi bacterium]|nr:hypothetical protein [Chloroflexota bacterium]
MWRDSAVKQALPPLPLADWQDTAATLHMWTQMVGKVRMALVPALNHWWHVTLYVTPRGLHTAPMPHGPHQVDMSFDFLYHTFAITCSDGRSETIELRPRSVADFYAAFVQALAAMELEVSIWPVPVEVPDPIPFAEDTTHAAYDSAAVERWFAVLRWVNAVFTKFRGGFLGKSSPSHFFWGGFDLAITRYSGRRAPEREWPFLAAMQREAYSHEVISGGFWPGTPAIGGAAYFAYAAPEPDGFRDAAVKPGAAHYDTNMGLFLLKHDDLRQADDPEQALLDFLQTVYDAGATLGGWDRAALER